MEHVIRHVFSGHDYAKALAIGRTLQAVAKKMLITFAVLVFTYGLLAAEVELAKLEGFPAAVVR